MLTTAFWLLLNPFSGFCLQAQPSTITTKETYAKTLAAIKRDREVLAAHLTADPIQQAATLNEAADLLAAAIGEQLAPHWYGTKWDYNGTTETPGRGRIACGYFVTTLLRDAGLKIPRVRFAQVASETMIKSLVTPASIKRFSNVPIEDFVNTIETWGKGVHVVGLDQHTGFIIHDETGVWFVHSSFQKPYQVVREKALDAAILVSSRYRVLGKLDDPELLRRWLQKESFY